jgi:uncharacterized protein YndB with AHSA1/START domain
MARGTWCGAANIADLARDGHVEIIDRGHDPAALAPNSASHERLDPLMAMVSRDLSVPPQRVFDVFEDGWLFPLWVVGTSHMRAVDRGWPQKGTRLHHAFGAWPFVVRDSTEVLDYEPPRRLVVQARAWPAGQARIELDVEKTSSGSRVTITEFPVSGIGKAVHNPVFDAALYRRNVETLARLAALAEGRASGEG